MSLVAQILPKSLSVTSTPSLHLLQLTSRNADFPGVGLNPDGCLQVCVVEAGLVTLSNETLDFVVVRVGAERRNVVVSKSIRLDGFS